MAKGIGYMGPKTRRVPDAERKTVMICFAVDPRVSREVRAAAKAEGVGISEWVRRLVAAELDPLS